MLVSLHVTVLIATGYPPFLITTTWSTANDKILDYYHNLNNLKIIIIKLLSYIYYLELIFITLKIVYVVNLSIYHSIIKK